MVEMVRRGCRDVKKMSDWEVESRLLSFMPPRRKGWPQGESANAICEAGSWRLTQLIGTDRYGYS